jgi:hypothetical protein
VAVRKHDPGPVEPLEPLPEHWPVPLSPQARSDVDDTLRIDPHEVPVVCEVVDCTEGQPVDDRGDSLGVGVSDDVRSLHEVGLARRARLTAGAYSVWVAGVDRAGNRERGAGVPRVVQ